MSKSQKKRRAKEQEEQLMQSKKSLLEQVKSNLSMPKPTEEPEPTVQELLDLADAVLATEEVTT